ncbi:MAG: hypothetical protein JO293_08320, partial [Candidatus Eremiobacteraeota bacterium]|nr:hypothetical protein [Candidatus Eremiobacteraeota bacterium]
MPGRPYIIVANRLAGLGDAHRLVATVTHALDTPPSAVIDADVGVAFKQQLNDALRAANGDAAASTASRALLVCIGGDGTVSLAFDALASPDSVTLAVVPCGSGNDLAQTLGIKTTSEAIDVLRSG